MAQTVSEIKALLANADAEEFASIERSLAADTRKGVLAALDSARRRIEKQTREERRLEGMFAFQAELARERGAHVLVGLDEVGRGPVAGPLTVGAVVLPDDCRIQGLNDSKQVSPKDRERIAREVKERAIAWTVVHCEPARIDERGMSACLKESFARAVRNIEAAGVKVDLILLDGNPLHIDEREVNIVKGDAKCASIAAASIVAKVERDALMCSLDREYPVYGWADNKGYGAAAHIEAIRKYGLSPLHRKSFCMNFLQDSLF